MTLDKAHRGQRLTILSFPDDLTRAQALRLGFAEGTVIVCREVVPAGPVVISTNRQELAVGRMLAKRIDVEPLSVERKQ